MPNTEPPAAGPRGFVYLQVLISLLIVSSCACALFACLAALTRGIEKIRDEPRLLEDACLMIETRTLTEPFLPRAGLTLSRAPSPEADGFFEWTARATSPEPRVVLRTGETHDE